MTTKRGSLLAVGICGAVLCASLWTRVSWAYVEIPYTLGRIIQEATQIAVLRVEKVDKTRNLILYRKVQDLKGGPAPDVVKHNIGQGGFHPREWQTIMTAAEPGQIAVFFNNGGASETCSAELLVSGVLGGRVVEHEPRRAVLPAELRRPPGKTGRRGDRDARRTGSRRSLHGGWRQERAGPAHGENPADEGQPQAAGLRPEARLRRLGGRGLPLPRGNARFHPLCRAGPFGPWRCRHHLRRHSMAMANRICA